MKRSIVRTLAAVTAAIAPFATVSAVAPAAQAASVSAAQKADGIAPAKISLNTETQGLSEDTTTWRSIIKSWNDKGFDNIQEVSAYSPSMKRHIPLVVIQPKDKEKRDNAPTLYMLNGADGGQGIANWIRQTDIVTYYGGNSDPSKGTVSPGIGANIVIPMTGAYSYYTDWVTEPNTSEIKGPQKWETFLTRELPQAIEPALKANDKRAIAGMSMTGTTSLLYAQHHPGFYDSVGSFSGCAATTTGLTPKFIDLVLNRGGTDFTKMWGPVNGEVARNNDALINAEKLRGQKNIYVSTSSGFPGEHDMPWSERVNGQLSSAAPVIFEGAVIEGATNACTRDLARKTNALGIPVKYNFRPAGTHQWGYWQDDLRSYWNDLVNGLGTGAKRPPLQPTKPISPEDYWAGSTSGS
ncbi:alpha/beta hydrolase [Corynebacterium jeikeium]|uniref:alpha/beta hydrolase n=1 Tax=Corynebacterium macclintockiae TaxID=2913501 RepID=UPI00054DF760